MADERIERPERTTGQLLRELSEETATLLRQEVELAKTEMSEKASRLGRNVAYLAIGGAIVYIGLTYLVLALVAGVGVSLANVMSVATVLWLSPLIVGLVVAIVGYVLLHKSIGTMKREGIVPRETVQTMRENKVWLKHELT